MSTALANLVQTFSKKYSLEGLIADKQGGFEWYVDGKLIRVFSSVGKLYLDAEIRKLSTEEGDRFNCMKTALRASLANAYAYQESLYIDAQNDTLCLYRCTPLNSMTLGGFETLLEGFMHALDSFTELTAMKTSQAGPRLVAL